MIDPMTGEIIDQKELAEALLEQAREQGVSLLGPGGLLAGLTKNVLETALEAEITEHLGHERHGPAESGNIRNGTRSKTVFSRDLKPIYTAPTEAAAKERFGEFEAKWAIKYPAIGRLWRNAWPEFAPFLDWDAEIRRVICSTNAIESLNARYRRAVRARGHFPNDAAALKCLYLVTRSLDPTGHGRARWAIRWKPALNAFAIAFEGRIK